MKKFSDYLEMIQESDGEKYKVVFYEKNSYIRNGEEVIKKYVFSLIDTQSKKIVIDNKEIEYNVDQEGQTVKEFLVSFINDTKKLNLKYDDIQDELDNLGDYNLAKK